MRALFHLQTHRRPRAWLVSLALGMLVLLQTLGAAHGIVHGPLASGAAGASAWQVSSAGSADADGFGLHQAHSADCQLFDQLAHADLAWAAPLLWAPNAHTTPLHATADTPSAAATALAFRARAPPSLA